VSRARAYDDIDAERERQERLLREGKFLWTCADPRQSNVRRLAVLAEEFGEASRNVTEEMIRLDKGNAAGAADAVRALRKELVEVAAVAVAWLEALDAQEKM
jgi:hypothetical protein